MRIKQFKSDRGFAANNIQLIRNWVHFREKYNGRPFSSVGERFETSSRP